MKNIVCEEKKELKRILSTLNYPYKLKTVDKNIPIFRVTFKHQFLQSFKERVTDWIEYYDSVIDYFLTPKKKRHNVFKPFKPIHLKSSCMPIDELLLEIRLKKNGFSIIEEDLGNLYTAYDISKI